MERVDRMRRSIEPSLSADLIRFGNLLAVTASLDSSADSVNGFGLPDSPAAKRIRRLFCQDFVEARHQTSNLDSFDPIREDFASAPN